MFAIALLLLLIITVTSHRKSLVLLKLHFESSAQLMVIIRLVRVSKPYVRNHSQSDQICMSQVSEQSASYLLLPHV